MSMNIYRLCGDASHLLAICFLLLQLCRARNARGVSVKTQELFLLVFLTRYLDLFTSFYSIYNSVLKVVYIALTAYTIYMIKCQEPIRSLYNPSQDDFPHWKFAVAPCAVIAILTYLCQNGLGRFKLIELLWTFSIYLEALAILPQLVVLRRYRLVENLTGKFMLFLGSYRALYIVNWIYRSHTEKYYQHHYVVYFCGVVQTLMYVDFFYQYLRVRCGVHRPEEGEEADDEDAGLLFEQELSSSRVINISADPLMPDDNDDVEIASPPPSAERRKNNREEKLTSEQQQSATASS